MSKKILLLTVFIFSVQVYSQDLLMQDGTFNQCMGTFLDSGGGSAGYSNNENFTITICPDIPGEAISINFTAFNTENPFDFLSIFDGTDDTAAPLGTFTGINSPGLVEPSDANTSGCLTFVWTSDNSIPLAGWSADISCFTPCQNIIANVDSTVPGSTSANVVVADVNDSITFNGSGTFTTGGIGATYLWDFGDGNTGLGESVNHTYTTAGFYVVTLTITDTDGCTSTNNIGLTAQIGTTSPGNPSVDAGDDIDIPCTETCTTLTASFLDIGETNTYTVTDIAYVPPFPFDGLTNSVNTNIDDAWDDVEDLPFDFCFFDNVETQFQVGSNGLIRFDVNPNDASNAWNLNDDTLPNNSNPALGEGNIFTPVHDIDPTESTGEEIAWEIIGTAPNRVLAVSFFEVPMYDCTSELATQMAVFYETTNVIDIYIQDAPYCDWNGNNKAVGIQNDAGTQAFVPPGRNTNEGGTFTQPGWTAQDEAWRFTPAGPSIVEFAWLDDMGNVLSTDASFEVCPTDASTTYTAQVTYTNCNGDITIVTDDVTVTTNSPFTVDLGPDVNQCEGDADVNLDATTAGATTYQWSLDGVDLVGETNPTLTVISPNSGNYLVTVTDATGCIDTDAVLINYAPIPDPSFTVTPTCDGGTVTITGDTGGTFTFNPIPTDGAVIDTATGEVTGGTSATTYTIEYTTAGACPDTSTQDVTVLTSEDSSFTVTPTCDGGTVVITGDPGGTFTFNPIPTDGAVIDTATGEVTGGTSATTYTIEYTTAGACPDTSTQDVTVLTSEDSSFTVTPTCDGGTVVITGDPGGTFTFNPIPTDGAVIDTATGEVTGGTSATTYTIEYTTVGTCSSTSTQDVTVLSLDDSSFTVTPTCDGGTVVITGDPGGTFTFNPIPTDGAVIDTATGEVTGGTSAATYTIEYTTVGACPDTSTQDVTVLTSEDSSFTVTPTCDGGTVVITGDPGGTFTFNPIPTDGAVIDTATGEVTGGTSATTYTIEYTTAGACPDTSTQDVTVLTSEDSSFTVTPTCDGGTVVITGDPGGTFTFNPIPTDGAVIDTATGEVTGGTSATTYTIEYTTAGACPDTSTQDVTVLSLDDSSFTVTPTCDGGTVVITGDPGGTFTFNPIPTDGAVIDTATGEVTGGTFGTTYTIEYTTAGACPDTSTQDVTVLSLDDPSFTVTPTCDGGTVVITGDPGGTFTFNPIPTDGAVIDTATGEVTGGTSATTYTIEYTTAGACPDTSTQDVTVLTSEDSSFTVTPTCDGGTVVITGDPGGTFTFNPIPTDGAVIDTATGEVTGGTSATTYTIEYTTAGACPDTSTQDVTVLTSEDSSFTVTPTCDGGTVVITGDPGGTFTFNPIPTDGAVIDTATGEVTGGTSATTYTIEYTTVGTCSSTTTQDVTVLSLDDPSFTVTPTCDGGTVVITGDPGGTFTFNPIPTDGAVIDTATGEVTGGTSATTYTIEYTTAGACPDTSTQDVTVLTSEDSSFTVTPTCDGGTVVITGDPGGTFTFNPIPTDGAVIDTATGEVTGGTSATTYTIEYTTAGACPDTSTQDVTVLTSEDSSFTVTPTCDGGTVMITGDTGGTFTFNPIPTDGAVIDTATGEVTGGTSATTYTIEYTTVGTCSSTTTQDVTVLSLDDSSFTVTPTCDGGTVVITGDPGGTFTFNPIPTDGAVIDTATGEVTGGTSATTYTIEYTTVGTCSSTSTQDVTVLSLDDSSFTVTPTCDGGTVVITGDPGGTFTFNPIPTDGAVIDTATGEVTGGTSATTYTIEYTTAGACPDTSTQDVTVLTSDDSSFTVTPTCDGGTVVITGDPGGTFTFNPIPTDGAVIDTATGEVTGGTSATTYTIEYTTVGTCSSTTTQDVTVLSLDDSSFTVTPTCDGGTVVITGDPGGTFTFNPIPTDGAVIDTATGEVTGGTSATTYTIEYTLLNICSSTSAVTFMVNPLPNDAGIPSDFLECENNTDFKFDFDLETKNSEILNGQDQTMFTVTYHDSQADADNLVDPLVSPYENISNPQLIFVAITNNMTGCSVSSQSFNIEVLNGASAFDDFYEECDVVNDNDGFTQFDLDSRSPIIMNGADPFAFSISYYFSFDDAVNDINPLPFLYENLTNPQIIYARVSNNIRPEDCFEISELTLQTNLLPIFDLDDTYTLCLTSNNEAVVSIPLVIDTELSDANYSFEWRFNGNILTTETDSSLIPTQSGTYSVLVTDTSTSTVTMCTNFDETVVVEGGIPDTFDIEVVSEIFIGNNVIIATVTGNSEYEFSLDNGPWQLSGEFENVSCGDHTVAVRDVLGCGILFKDITLIDYPKFFTPNGDGNNDTWTIKGIDSQPSAVIYIYNRFGKLLKQLSPTGPGWDGTYNGKKMPSSDYWFTLEYTEPINDEKRTFSAHFALKR